ncbi:MAG: 50S ribosomal protein L5 [Candidatus Paraimprobicoccus trichonymphae]|uniref:Large ribosomal subunit protein uL5 n=1 Tax=Candidatus Paraimprobicoccus trichonymphae TaxID=3033793 RepID=A0AA48I4J3_9FIRM|nr:MAG: 50S ribosomal protein L5 [Candidatus Paraimprobicoccus trichonymphae]
MSRLKEYYKSQIVDLLLKKFSYKNKMQVPRLKKIIINSGVGDSKDNSKTIINVVNDLSLITGQKPVVCKAKKSVSNFKVREGMKIAAKVTLRNKKMFVFIDKLFNFALPRVRDFKGINLKSFDGRGNYNLGIKEQLIFPEIKYDKIDKIRGMDISITTTAKTDSEAKELLLLLGAPFKAEVF